MHFLRRRQILPPDSVLRAAEQGRAREERSVRLQVQVGPESCALAAS